MSLDALKQRVAPPVAPLETGSPEQWAAAEAQLGVQFPDDYKALVDTYGTGGFNDFLYVFNPFARNQYRNLFKGKDVMLDAYNVSRSQFPEYSPYPAFPETGGLLPWGTTDNGDELYWQTEGQPNAWSLVLFDARHGRNERYQLGITDFLAQFFSGTLKSRVLPEDLLMEDEDQFFASRA
ncbi:MAG: SMI1/KNR4 family protein [Herpetosiphonaceae bacterium]|nr:SMI1/KNR4 family protein [Herpetosiphonaceae bacterium]